MHVVKIDIDSDILKKNFLDIKDFSGSIDFTLFEKQYVKEFNPYYVSCKVPVEDISSVQLLEKHGFSFIEFQIREVSKLKNPFNKFPFEPYKFEPVTTQNDLKEVLLIASNTFEHDRFSVDPIIPKSFSAERYRRYITKSFETPGEFVYKLYNSTTGEILGFKTHKIIAETEALMFLGGVANRYKKSPIPVINGYMELNTLISKGIKKVTTHISGGNYGVLNLEVKEMGYKVVNAFVVLRKIYGG